MDHDYSKRRIVLMVAVKEKRWKQERESAPTAVSGTTERTFSVAVGPLFSSDDMDDPSFSYFLSQNLESSSEGC